jgi:serine carboxypeptidase-like clade 2
VLKLPWLQIGNPLLEFNTDFNSKAEFLWSHGLISDSTYEIFTSICNYSQIRRQSASGSLTPDCSGVIRQASSEISKFIDTYDVTLDVCLPSLFSQSKVLNQLVRLIFFSFNFSSFHALYMYGYSVSPVSCTYIWSNLISHL